MYIFQLFLYKMFQYYDAFNWTFFSWTGVGTEEQIAFLSSHYRHSHVNLETYNNQPFIVGGSGAGFKTELMNSSNLEWTLADEYPSPLSWTARGEMNTYGSISTDTAVFIFGGRISGQISGNIAKYENMQWTIVGQLSSPRQNCIAVQMGNNFHVLGGYGGAYIDL